jgi:hypothetical protein
MDVLRGDLVKEKKKMNTNQEYVWYVGYGSNLNKQRFLCYILGGTPKYGCKSNQGCINKALPPEDRSIKIPNGLYFALPGRRKKTSNLEKGGVTFITPEKVEDKNLWTLGRMWKITKDQYSEIKKQEGPRWYNHEIYIGEDNGTPIYTITNKRKLNNNIAPNKRYLKTVVLGLKETYNMDNEEIIEYLIERNAIKENRKENRIIRTAGSIFLKKKI